MCCLDSGFGRRIRERFESAADLFQDDVQEFFHTVFTRVILSTALVECSFASFRRWVIKCGSAVGIENLSCRHTLQAFVRAMESMNPGMKIGAPILGSKRKRPPWVLKARTRAGYGKGLSGRDIFFSDWLSQNQGTFADANRAWVQASAQTKADCSTRAKAKRAVFNEILDPLKVAGAQLDEAEDEQRTDVKSPWGLGGPLWPLKASTLSKALETPGFIKDSLPLSGQIISGRSKSTTQLSRRRLLSRNFASTSCRCVRRCTLQGSRRGLLPSGRICSSL